MPLSDKYYKTKDSGNGWVLDVLHDEQPEELAKYCERGRDARAKKKARQRKRPLNKHSGAPHPTYRASSHVHTHPHSHTPENVGLLCRLVRARL